jgi:type VII secretion protein EccB
MASRRDQLQSHQFRTQRVISALVMRETDPAQSPLRRGIGAVFAGLMIAVVVAAGYGVYGLLTKTGASDWKTDGAVVIEKETGASYVYRDGQLHPMLNYASALLVAGTTARTVFREPAAALTGVPRGVMLGIPYAPDSIPAASDTVGAPWTLCSATAADASGSQSLGTTLALSVTPSGGTPLGDNGLLVRDPATSVTFLVWHGTRYAVAAGVLTSLFGVVTPAPAGTAFLNGLPRGADIGPFTVTGSGSPSSAAGAYAIGEVLSTPIGTGGLQFWMVVSDGLAPITEFQKDIAISQGAPGPTQVSGATAGAIHRSDQLSQDPTATLPPKPPKLVAKADPADRMCATFTAAGAVPMVTFGATLPSAGTPTGSRTSAGAVLADRVLVPAGHAAVVRVMASASAGTGGYFLITDLGIRYAVPSADALKALGFAASSATPIQAGLIALIPAGPTLDPVAAAGPAASSD